MAFPMAVAAACTTLMNLGLSAIAEAAAQDYSEAEIKTGLSLS
jgi:hypothetical protein